MTTRFSLPNVPRRLILAAFLLLTLLSVGLVLDLANRGLVWQFAWSVTGEEEPVGQVRGLLEWAVTQTRPLPRTAPLTPVNYAHVNPYGINTFWQLEVEEAKIERQAEMIADAGFGWIRQQFEWAEIEVDGRGQFTDSRNDVDGDGAVDTISGWLKYDRIVEIAEQHDLQIQARLDNPPRWTRADPDKGDFAPPDDVQDFVNFAAAVAERYQGRIRFYQVWNEPNIYPEWGNQPVDPEAYTDLLCRTYDALKAVDPDIVVISGALAPTISLTGRDLNDFIFLQRMYDAGAGRCFDILSMQAYGLFSGPTDQRMRPTTVNVARNQYIRELMIANGDAHKAIWFSEMAWNPVPSESDNPDVADRYRFGQVTPAQAADYAPQLYQRAQEEWSWVGVINYWFFTRPTDFERNQSFYYFRMVEPDWSEEKPDYTPLPIYDSLRDFITTQQPVLHEGAHVGEDHWAVRERELGPESAEADQFLLTAVQEYTFTTRGTDVRLRWQGRALTLAVNGYYVDLEAAIPRGDGGESMEIRLEPSLLPETRDIRLVTDFPFTLEQITVVDRTYERVFPLVAAALTGLVTLVFVLVSAWRGRRGKAT
ncbi:MAG: hypothetical protein SF029_10510 [bacterium]|nr:hypothetical protein [bacterium]